MLDPDTLPLLRSQHNLLAFSGGIDSTALFFLLDQSGITFDIALVNYQTREQSDDEAAYAQSLAKRFNKRCHIHRAEPITSNFEARARDVRYDFFETLIIKFGYETLITAHQLDDRLEWLLMQLCKGAGLPEMLGMLPVSHHPTHQRIRPLLQASKAQLKAWLDIQHIRYFDDDTNADTRYRRNYFRHTFAAELIEGHASGIRQTFEFLAQDNALLLDDISISSFGQLACFTPVNNRRALIIAIDRWLKQRSIVIRQGEKKRLHIENEVIVARRYAVSIGRSMAIAAPVSRTMMSKPFKERCRVFGIGAGVRPWLFDHPEAFRWLTTHGDAPS